MESSKAQGKRSFTYKMDQDQLDDEEEEEDDDDEENGELGFQEDDNYKKKRAMSTNSSSSKRGSGSGGSNRPACCQADNCNADLTQARIYYRRHKVCEFHAKAPVVLVACLQQRFCQQCSRFHGLSEFDENKKSCRRRLAGHNERRRKNMSYNEGEGSNV